MSGKAPDSRPGPIVSGGFYGFCMTRSVQALAYSRPSVLESSQAGQLLGLETAGGLTPRGAEPHPRFFAGFLASPRIAARGLLAVADVASARYYQRTRPSSLDPVVTGNGDRLRFESFSGCCGVYARLDVLQDGLDGAETGHGTTNVDVNNPLPEALSRIAGDDPLHLRVGPEETVWRSPPVRLPPPAHTGRCSLCWPPRCPHCWRTSRPRAG